MKNVKNIVFFFSLYILVLLFETTTRALLIYIVPKLMPPSASLPCKRSSAFSHNMERAIARCTPTLATDHHRRVQASIATDLTNLGDSRLLWKAKSRIKSTKFGAHRPNTSTPIISKHAGATTAAYVRRCLLIAFCIVLPSIRAACGRAKPEPFKGHAKVKSQKSCAPRRAPPLRDLGTASKSIRFWHVGATRTFVSRSNRSRCTLYPASSKICFHGKHANVCRTYGRPLRMHVSKCEPFKSIRHR